MNKLLVTLGLLFAIGCHKVVREEPIGEPFQREVTYSCQHVGYCYGMSINGNYDFGVSAVCPGTQTDTEIAQRYRVYYDNNTSDVEDSRVRTIQEGVCL